MKYAICPKCGGRLKGGENIGWVCESCGQPHDLGLGQFYPVGNENESNERSEEKGE